MIGIRTRIAISVGQASACPKKNRSESIRAANC
jgi:hypothetical protein